MIFVLGRESAQKATLHSGEGKKKEKEKRKKREFCVSNSRLQGNKNCQMNFD